MTAQLLLHWHLDEVVDAHGVLDSSDNRLNGHPEGTPKTLPDERFGSALVLDGVADAVSLADSPALRFPAGYTVEAWLNPTTLSAAGLVGTVAAAFALAVTKAGALQHLTAAGTAKTTTPDSTVRAAVWQHVALTCDGQRMATYVDGLLVAEQAVPTKHQAGKATDTLIVGRSPTGPKGWFDGRLAHVRIYDRPLDDTEIRLDMAEDEADLAAFVRSYPIDFELSNKDQQHVLYIDDAPAGQAMTVTVRNSSRQNIVFRPLAGAASATNYHLALGMRAQTLAVACQPAVSTPGWQLTRAGDTLYLLTADPIMLSRGDAVAIGLTGLNADGRAGTRGTRVDLDYRQVAFSGETDELTGTRMQYLDVVNHRGRTDAPLHADFNGGNRVLSDGASINTLVLRLTNLSHDVPLRLAGSDENPDAPTALTVAVDIEHGDESRAWALVSAAAVEGATLSVTGTSDPTAVPVNSWPQPGRDLGGQRLQWRLVAPRSVTLPPAGWIELRLDGIVVPLTTGQSAVAVGYVNLPGYADASVTVAVEKSPLMFFTTADRVPVQRLGIGTTRPDAKLHILDTPGDADRGTLILGPTGSVNLRLGFAGDHSWIQSHGSKPLAINPIGNNVGIGTTTPGAALTVKAHENHLQLVRDEASGDKVLFLELFQTTRASSPISPSIRFHHSNQFWHRIEAQSDGFYLKTGDMSRDTLSNVYANAASFATAEIAGDLRIHGIRLNERAMETIARLVNGELMVDLYSFEQGRSLGRVTLLLVPDAA